jgi:hypothetical protein
VRAIPAGSNTPALNRIKSAAPTPTPETTRIAFRRTPKTMGPIPQRDHRIGREDRIERDQGQEVVLLFLGGGARTPRTVRRRRSRSIACSDRRGSRESRRSSRRRRATGAPPETRRRRTSPRRTMALRCVRRRPPLRPSPRTAGRGRRAFRRTPRRSKAGASRAMRIPRIVATSIASAMARIEVRRRVVARRVIRKTGNTTVTMAAVALARNATSSASVNADNHLMAPVAA